MKINEEILEISNSAKEQTANVRNEICSMIIKENVDKIFEAAKNGLNSVFVKFDRERHSVLQTEQNIEGFTMRKEERDKEPEILIYW
jgi:allophanate hydrolase subunit 1